MLNSTQGQAKQRIAARTIKKPTRIQPAVRATPGRYFRWKNGFERCLAAVFLLPGLLIIAVLVLLVKITSPGPAIFRQLRVGRKGRTFWMYKIRTMRSDAEAATGPVWTSVGDPRVTPLGRVLRKLHLDEFPQLFNVLRGEMALIGPRPERPEFTQQLAVRIPDYLERLTVLPGITGLAQINLPPDTDLDSVRRKLVLDLEYIATAGFLLDLRMLLCTAVRLLGIHGEPAMRLFALKRYVPLPASNAESLDGFNGLPLAPASSPLDGFNEDQETAANHVAVTLDQNSHSQNGHSQNGHLHNGHAKNGHGTASELKDGTLLSGAVSLRSDDIS